jgi:Uri superfamily endonuclease
MSEPIGTDERLDRIEELEADLRKMALDYLAADGQAAEAYQAQLAAEAKLAKAVEALEKLARLGNGDRYGNSDGNMIARTTLAELKGETDA